MTDTIDASMTLAQVVDAHPELARELERRGLDYCCGGQRSLADAIAAAGLEVAPTIVELSSAGRATPPASWASMDAAELVDHLEQTHHRYLWDELGRVSTLLDKILVVHGQRHPELKDVVECFADLRVDLEPHMLKEERVLFPMIRELVNSTDTPTFHCGTLRNPITVMMREHEAVGDLLARLRQLTNDYTPPSDGCASYQMCFAALAELEADTHLHVHKENNVLFPLVLRLEARSS